MYHSCSLDLSQMMFFVKNLDDKSIPYQLDLDEDVEQLQRLIEEREKVSLDDQRILFNGRYLEAGHSLADYNVSSLSTLHLLVPLRGGAIEPTLMQLAKKYNIEKKVCRKCYARLHAKATNCRKRKCGHSSNLRPKKKPKT